MAHLKLSLSYFLDVMRNDHIRQETKEKCQPWNERKIGGRMIESTMNESTME